MKIIEREDYFIIRDIAKKYNMSIADLGRSIVRQSERTKGRAIRLSDTEYNYIKSLANYKNMTVSKFCGYACKAYIELDKKNIPIEIVTTKRDKRIEVRIYNSDDEVQLIKLANDFGMKISSLIRYCALHFDGDRFI